MKAMNPVAIRLLNQQLICPQLSNPADVVRYMGAMQAQDFRMMRWAVAMRTRNPSAKAFKTAFDNGQIVRLHLMRGTWQLVSAEDYWPLLNLCALKAKAVIKGWMSSNHISISDEELLRIREILVETVVAKESVIKEDFIMALTAKGIRMDDHRLSYHIRMAELDGILCSGELLPMKATYAFAEKKVGSKSTADRDEILLMLTRKYFHSRQPASLEDFVWWSGLNKSDCRKGIMLMGDDLHKIKYKNRELYITDDCRTHGFHKNRYLLIPPYDEYLISYKSRDIVLSLDYSHKAHSNNGIFRPVIALNGIICGNWAPFRVDGQIDFFLGDHLTDIQEEWMKYKNFLNK